MVKWFSAGCFVLWTWLGVVQGSVSFEQGYVYGMKESGLVYYIEWILQGSAGWNLLEHGYERALAWYAWNMCAADLLVYN